MKLCAYETEVSGFCVVKSIEECLIVCDGFIIAGLCCFFFFCSL